MNPGVSWKSTIASKKQMAIIAGCDILLASCASAVHGKLISILLR
ncbi:hypothetical protein LL260_003246 [Proteus mirabilis]